MLVEDVGVQHVTARTMPSRTRRLLRRRQPVHVGTVHRTRRRDRSPTINRQPRDCNSKTRSCIGGDIADREIDFGVIVDGDDAEVSAGSFDEPGECRESEIVPPLDLGYVALSDT